MQPTLKTEIFALLAAKILAGKKATGRTGMDLWQILVLGVVRLGLDADWDRLEHIANYDTLVRQFYVPNPALVTALQARLTRDDAAIIYLNGAEVWRDTNLTSGTVTYTTPALVALGGTDETNWLTLNFQLSTLNLLVPSWNTLAAEVHNQSLTSSDLGFNFELTGTAVIAAPPRVSVAATAGSFTFSWPIDASYFALYSATNLSPPVAWTPLTNTSVLISNQWRLTLPAASNGSRFYRLQTP